MSELLPRYIRSNENEFTLRDPNINLALCTRALNCLNVRAHFESLQKGSVKRLELTEYGGLSENQERLCDGSSIIRNRVETGMAFHWRSPFKSDEQIPSVLEVQRKKDDKVVRGVAVIAWRLPYDRIDAPTVVEVSSTMSLAGRGDRITEPRNSSLIYKDIWKLKENNYRLVNDQFPFYLNLHLLTLWLEKDIDDDVAGRLAQGEQLPSVQDYIAKYYGEIFRQNNIWRK